MVTRGLNPWVQGRFQHLHTIERKRIAPPTTEAILRLNRGEQPMGWPSNMVEDLWDTYNAHRMHQYPNYVPLYEALAKRTGYPMEQIVVGQGIEEFIKTLPLLCCAPEDSWAVTWPTCAMYEIYAKAWNIDLIKIQTYFDRTLLPPEIMRQLKPNTRLLMLPNPGQPVETYFDPSAVEYLARECAQFGILLAMDEAHIGFGAESALGLVKHHENLIVLRTFSKMFGGASLRVGYAVASPMMAKALHAVRESGEVSGASMHVAIELLNKTDEVFQRTRAVREGADWLRDRINSCGMGLRARGQYGFSLLVDCGHEQYKTHIVNWLAAAGIFVKGDFEPPLHRCFLLACGDTEMMALFYDYLLQSTNSGLAPKAVE